MRRVCNELGQTILMVTHEPEQREYSDRVIWLRDGLIEREELITSSIREEAVHNSYRTVDAMENKINDEEYQA
jgi:ABC-type lipoprotein export system ATPase subunit